MASRPVISFLADNNVPDSIGAFLIARGHKVTRLREVMATDSKDPVVAKAAMKGGQVLITWDKDFRQPRYSALSRVTMRCPEPQGVARLEQVIHVIEFAWLNVQGQDVPLVVQVNARTVSLGT